MNKLLRPFIGIVLLAIVVPQASADMIRIGESDFSTDATVITFETWSTQLPTVTGAKFVHEGRSSQPGWFAGSSNFKGFFGAQGWSNSMSGTFSDLAIAFDSPVEAVGGYVGRIFNSANASPSSVVVELFDESRVSLGATAIDIPTTVNTPVFVGFAAERGISRLEIRTNNSGFIGVDNVTFGSLAVIPEPNSLVLVGLGAAGILAWVKRRRA